MNPNKLEPNELLVESDNIISQILSEKHYAELLSSNLDAQNIVDTGCFTVTSKSRCKKLISYSLTGLGIPNLDPCSKHYATAKGLSLHHVELDRLFVISSEAMPKYLSQKSERNSPYFAPIYKRWDKLLSFKKVSLRLPEREKKADLLDTLGYAAIAMQNGGRR